jgi:hypothetical protein
VTDQNESLSPEADDQRAGESDIAEETGNPVSHLDGNAAAGPLGELFRVDVVAAIGRCDHCGAERAVGETSVYADAPGIVVRCRSCDGVLLRLVETPTHFWLDVRGLSYLRIDRGA